MTRTSEGLHVTPIARVSSPVTDQTDGGWGDVTSRIEMVPGFEAGIAGLEQFSHLVVITFLHQASFESARHLVRRPRGLPSMPAVGIFAQRAKDRPNPIGITAVRILAVTGNAVTVRGLDAIDGTPVLDLKPYYPAYDLVVDASVPEWVTRLMEGYF